MPSNPMQPGPTLTVPDLQFLQLLAGLPEFVGRRCLYLFQHPDGKPGQKLTFDPGAQEIVFLLQGALIDLLGEVPRRLDGEWRHVAWFDMPNEPSVTIHLRLEDVPEPKGIGADFLRRIAKSWTVEDLSDKRTLIIEIDSSSLRAGLKGLPFFYLRG